MTTAVVGALAVLAIAHIRVNEDLSIRTVKKDSRKFQELMQDIRARGIKQPLEVRPLSGAGSAGFYVLTDGLHRYTAAAMLGIKEVPCIIRDVPDKEVIAEQFASNFNRINQSAADDARAMRKFLAQNEDIITIDQLAERMGVSRTHIDARLRIANLPRKDAQNPEAPIPGGIDVAELVNSGAINPSNASQLARLVMDPFLPDEQWADLVDQAKVKSSQAFTAYVQAFLNTLKQRKLGAAAAGIELRVPVLRKKSEIETHLSRIKNEAARREVTALSQLPADASEADKDACRKSAVPESVRAVINVLEWALQIDDASWAAAQKKEEERKKKLEEARQLKQAGDVAGSLKLAGFDAKAEKEAARAQVEAMLKG